MLERLKVGPYAVALNASLIMNYRGGIFRNNACGSNDVNHGVTLIGNDKNGNWILQNSWG